MDWSDGLLGIDRRDSSKCLLALLEVRGEILSVEQLTTLDALNSSGVMQHPLILLERVDLVLE